MLNWTAQLRWIGLAALSVALLANPGPPYQDATAEQDAMYHDQMVRFEVVFTIGIVLSAIGFIARRFVKEKPVCKPSFLDRIYERYIAE